MNKMANFVASRWRRDLTHFIGCCWSAQIGSLEWDEWCVAITIFWDCLGAAFRGRGNPGPQGEPKAHQDEARQGGYVSGQL